MEREPTVDQFDKVVRMKASEVDADAWRNQCANERLRCQGWARTLSRATAIEDRSLVMLSRISTQVGMTKFMQIMAKKKKPRMVRLDEIPATESNVVPLHITRQKY